MIFKYIFMLTGVFFSGCVSSKDLIETNQRAVNAYYEAYNKQDIEGQIALMSPSFEHFTNAGKTESGVDAYRKYTKEVYSDVKEEVYQMHVLVGQNPSQIAVQSRAKGEYLKIDKNNPKAQPKKYDIPLAEFFEITSGKITKLSSYYNELEWKNQVSQTTQK